MNDAGGVSVDRERGWSDVPLTKEGRQEGQRAGIKLRGKGIEAIVASDLARSHETAVIIGNLVGVKPQFSHELRPWNLGSLTGKEMSEAQPVMEKYARQNPDKPVPDGESFNDFKNRALAGVAKAIRQAKGMKLLIVTHHRVERLLCGWDKAGQTDGKIDLNCFFQKGDPPGGIIEMNLNDKQLSASHSNSSSLRTETDDPVNFRERGAKTSSEDPRHHSLAIGGAHHLHMAGHITKKQRDDYQKAARSHLMRAALRSR